MIQDQDCLNIFNLDRREDVRLLALGTENAETIE